MRFDELELTEELLDGLDTMNFQEMTPVQEKAIPIILEGRDVVASAQTGTGKTAAFVLPLLNQLSNNNYQENKIKAIIMAPTRELAQQIDTQIEGFSYFLPVSSLLVYGGGTGPDWEVQKRGMKLGADIIVATPGRLISHLEHSKIDLSHVKHFILDEADKMLDMGFADDIKKIVEYLPEDRQTVLFSATMPLKIQKLIASILHNPVHVNVAVSKPNESIEQFVYICYENQKLNLVEHIIKENPDQTVIIFCSSKKKVGDVAYHLKRKKIRAAAMHSDLEQDERQQVLLDYRNRKLDVLVATDILSRGIDIDNVGLVINWDLPMDTEDYIHRIGRTGRADAKGKAISLIGEKEQRGLIKVCRLIGRDIEQLPIPEYIGESPEFNPNAGRTPSRHNRPNNNRPHHSEEHKSKPVLKKRTHFTPN